LQGGFADGEREERHLPRLVKQGVVISPLFARIIFALGLVFAASPWASPPIALAVGLALGLLSLNPFRSQTKSFTRYLLQASVVLLGFGMNLASVLRAGRSGIVYTAVGITATLAIGTALGKMLQVKRTPSFLISTGTAICGGSAIAAVGPIVGANDEEMSISLGTVFILNSVALLIFPAIGMALHLTQQQFGLWAALAIHDTSSVVGAAHKYGEAATVVATTVKLARALWIVPLCIVTAAVKRSKAKVQWPWFIGFFVLAAVANTYAHALAPAFPLLYRLGGIGLTITLFLIGSGISQSTLKSVGARPLVQGVVLWAIVAVGSLLFIRTFAPSF
jgi:uncharacterized integral membrane protein (TIGR00698 family)